LIIKLFFCLANWPNVLFDHQIIFFCTFRLTSPLDALIRKPTGEHKVNDKLANQAKPTGRTS
jgi:hypothetical protein